MWQRTRLEGTHLSIGCSSTNRRPKKSRTLCVCSKHGRHVGAEDCRSSICHARCRVHTRCVARNWRRGRESCHGADAPPSPSYLALPYSTLTPGHRSHRCLQTAGSSFRHRHERTQLTAPLLAGACRFSSDVTPRVERTLVVPMAQTLGTTHDRAGHPPRYP